MKLEKLSPSIFIKEVTQLFSNRGFTAFFTILVFAIGYLYTEVKTSYKDRITEDTLKDDKVIALILEKDSYQDSLRLVQFQKSCEETVKQAVALANENCDHQIRKLDSIIYFLQRRK